MHQYPLWSLVAMTKLACTVAEDRSPCSLCHFQLSAQIDVPRPHRSYSAQHTEIQFGQSGIECPLPQTIPPPKRYRGFVSLILARCLLKDTRDRGILQRSQHMRKMCLHNQRILCFLRCMEYPRDDHGWSTRSFHALQCDREISRGCANSLACLSRQTVPRLWLLL